MILAAVWVFAQADGDFDPISLFQQIGIGALLAGPAYWLWRTERKDRIASEAREREVSARALPLLATAAETLKEVQQGMAATVDRAHPDSQSLDITVRRLELAIDEIRRDRPTRERE